MGNVVRVKSGPQHPAPVLEQDGVAELLLDPSGARLVPDILMEAAAGLCRLDQVADDIVALRILEVPPFSAHQMFQSGMDEIGAVELVDEEIPVFSERHVVDDLLDFLLGGRAAARLFLVDPFDGGQCEADIVADFLPLGFQNPLFDRACFDFDQPVRLIIGGASDEDRHGDKGKERNQEQFGFKRHSHASPGLYRP